MEHTGEYFERLAVEVYLAAEKLASEVPEEGLTKYPMAVEFDDYDLTFEVDCMVSNLEVEEETNSRTYNVEIFCTDSPFVEDEKLGLYMYEHFKNETLYKD